MLTLLTVAIIGIGGPPRVPPHEIANGSITIIQNNRIIASTSKIGNIALRLRPGVYLLKAELTEGGGPCQTKTIRLEHKHRNVDLGCSIA